MYVLAAGHDVQMNYTKHSNLIHAKFIDLMYKHTS